VELRIDVLRRPLGLELDPIDPEVEAASLHLAAFAGELVVGTLVLEPVDGSTLKMRQVATRDGFRRRGIATGLVAAAEDLARSLGHRRLIAHARESAVGFYRRLGYEIGEAPFIEVTLPHRRIAKDL
jgi:GNAT superfamily N-acetyltransferase